MQYRILVVDDEREMAIGIGEFLREGLNGAAEVAILFSSRTAMEQMDAGGCDVLLTDIQMPGLDGFDLLRHIKAQKLKTRVIFLTGFQRFDYAYEAAKYPGTRFVVKMEREETIVACVREVLAELDADARNNEIVRRAQERLKAAEQVTSESYMKRIVQGYHDVPSLREGEGGLEETVSSVKEYIRAQSGGELTVASVAARFHFHPAYLSRVFRELAGVKLSSFILEKKMDDAKELLRESVRPVQEISQLLGYQSPQAFGRVFKKELGITPNEYRRRYGVPE